MQVVVNIARDPVGIARLGDRFLDGIPDDRVIEPVFVVVGQEASGHVGGNVLQRARLLREEMVHDLIDLHPHAHPGDGAPAGLQSGFLEAGDLLPPSVGEPAVGGLRELDRQDFLVGTVLGQGQVDVEAGHRARAEVDEVMGDGDHRVPLPRAGVGVPENTATLAISSFW